MGTTAVTSEPTGAKASTDYNLNLSNQEGQTLPQSLPFLPNRSCTHQKRVVHSHLLWQSPKTLIENRAF